MLSSGKNKIRLREVYTYSVISSLFLGKGASELMGLNMKVWIGLAIRVALALN